MHRFLPALLLLPASAFAAGNLPTIGGIPVDFILFALTLLGVALFHHYTLYVALTGLFTSSASTRYCSPASRPASASPAWSATSATSG
jgi:hypothetical protein